jgi:hypothetical protein
MRLFFAGVILAVVCFVYTVMLLGCGGGGGGNNETTTPPTTSRSNLYYGYYGSGPTQYEATKDHINILFEATWNGTSPIISDLQLSSLPTILQTPIYDAPTLIAFFTTLHQAGVLRYVVALYPYDEPDVNGWTDQQVTATIQMQKTVAAMFPELAGVKFAVIYGPGSNRPGIASYDWAGFDDYNAGAGAVGQELDSFETLLTPEQRVIIIPGGADPWRQDPAAFFNRAQADPKVLILLPFLWVNYSGGEGIGDNGEAPLYRQYGLAIVTNF